MKPLYFYLAGAAALGLLSFGGGVYYRDKIDIDNQSYADVDGDSFWDLVGLFKEAGKASHFDIFGTPYDKAPQTDALTGTWSYLVQSYPQQDKGIQYVQAFLANKAVTGYINPDGRYVYPIIRMSCASNEVTKAIETEAYVIAGDGLVEKNLAGSNLPVSIQIDNRERAEVQTQVNDNANAFGFPNAAAFVKELAGAKQLSLSYRLQNGQSVQASYNLKGFDIAIAPIAQRCGWKL